MYSGMDEVVHYDVDIIIFKENSGLDESNIQEEIKGELSHIFKGNEL